MHFVIVVNRHRVAANRRRTDGHLDPVFRVSKGKSGKPTYVHRCLLDRNALLMYSPDAPLPCGATVWIETDEVRVQDETGKLVTLGSDGPLSGAELKELSARNRRIDGGI